MTETPYAALHYILALSQKRCLPLSVISNSRSLGLARRRVLKRRPQRGAYWDYDSLLAGNQRV